LNFRRPVSEPGSPVNSRSSTPRHFTDNESDTDSDDSETSHALNSTTNSDKSFNYVMSRPKSMENMLKNLVVKDEQENSNQNETVSLPK
jgi:hypothetical protein